MATYGMEKIFAKYIYDEELIFKVYKKTHKTQKQNNTPDFKIRQRN